MSTGPAVPLREFSRHHVPALSDSRTRIVAVLLTGGLYAVFALLAWWSLNHVPVPAGTTEITARLLADVPTKLAREPLPPVLAHLLKPRAEVPALPVITIAPAPLAASAAETSPLLGGMSGNGPGQAASGTGTGGNGGTSAGCLDAVWMRAVSERVRQFFYYPAAALAVRRTGLVMVHFGVRRNGQMERLQISKSSGDEELDKAAIDIMQKAQPLPPIPDRMHTDRVDGELPINFGVRSFSGSSTTGTCGG
jgi:protein TonB